MDNIPGNGTQRRKKILLVEEHDGARRERAIILSTHGYEVQTTNSAAEAHQLWHATRPDLVLLAAERHTDTAQGLWEAITQADPQQRIAFLHADSLYLCPVLHEGEIVRKPEVTGDFLERVGALLG